MLLYVRRSPRRTSARATAVAPPPRQAGDRRTGRAPLRGRANRCARHLALSAGQADEAWAAFDPVVALLREGEVGELGVLPVHAEAIDALLMLGDVERARALAGELDAAARWPWLRAAAARCRGLLLAAEGDTDAALRELAGAVEHPALDMPFALARTELALGRGEATGQAARRRAGVAGRGRGGVRGAGRSAVGRPRPRRGGAARRPPARDDAGLTATKRGVAELAAAGRSNREIAGELFVSSARWRRT